MQVKGLSEDYKDTTNKQQLVDEAVDVLDGLRDLTAAAGLFLARALHLLGDRPHLLAALHDELRPSGLLGRCGGDLLGRLCDAPDGVGDLLAAL